MRYLLAQGSPASSSWAGNGVERFHEAHDKNARMFNVADIASLDATMKELITAG